MPRLCLDDGARPANLLAVLDLSPVAGERAGCWLGLLALKGPNRIARGWRRGAQATRSEPRVGRPKTPALKGRYRPA